MIVQRGVGRPLWFRATWFSWPAILWLGNSDTQVATGSNRACWSSDETPPSTLARALPYFGHVLYVHTVFWQTYFRFFAVQGQFRRSWLPPEVNERALAVVHADHLASKQRVLPGRKRRGVDAGPRLVWCGVSRVRVGRRVPQSTIGTTMGGVGKATGYVLRTAQWRTVGAPR
jgi:hypothetical protein